MAKIAVCVGQNEYGPATGVSALRGCVNDTLLIGEMLRLAGFEVIRQVHNQAATQSGILDRISAAAAKLREGDYFVFWNSSHGYQIRDRSGDELVDGLDEAITTYDTDPRDPLADDKFAQVLARVHPEAVVFFASDSCHSGTLTKAQNHEGRMPRLWIPPDDVLFRTGRPTLDLADYAEGISKPKQAEPTVRRLGRLSEEPEEMRHVFLSGCRSEEVSWDAPFDVGGEQRFHGAMTYHFAKVVLKAWNKSQAITYSEAHEQASEALGEADFDQHPQLEGIDKLKDRPVFGMTF